MEIIINIGAGLGCLRSDSLKYIINLDIYHQIVPYGIPAFTADTTVEYSNVCEHIDYVDGHANIILAISPYGFPVLNSETLRVLKAGGYFVVLGNNKNPFIKDEFKLKSPEFICLHNDSVTEICWAKGSDLVVDTVTRILNSFPSQTTDGSRTTDLNLVRVFRKQ